MNTCPVCGDAKRKKLGEKSGFNAYRCSKCRSLYTDKLSEASADFDYADYYDDSNLSAPDFVRLILLDTIRGFEPYRGENRLLDVGCGAGTILEAAQELEWDAQGIEVSLPAVSALKDRGFAIFHGTLQEAKYPDGYFDVVTATEVIEHVDDPTDFLREIARILKPNGLLWMTTPHANGLSARLMGAKWSVVCPPEHLHLFSVQGLADLLTAAGFGKARFATTGVNPSEILRYLRGRSVEHNVAAPDGEESFDRVQTGYKLNQWLVSGKQTKRLKDLMNSGLSAARLGDSMKIWAIR